MRILFLTSASLGVLVALVLLFLLIQANQELEATTDSLESAQAEGMQLENDLRATTQELTDKTAENETLTTDLNATTQRLTDKVAENETLTADLNTTTEELTNKIAENKSLTTNLRSTTQLLTSEMGENETLTADFNATSKQLAEKIAQGESLTASLDETTEQLTGKIAENETLTTDLNTTTEELNNKIAENEALTSDLESKTQLLADKTSAYEILTAEHEELTLSHETLVRETGNLEDVKNERDSLLSQVDSLNSTVSRLRGDISALEQRRRPLIVRTITEGFLCTGSMEPKITCLDSATWLVNFKPEDIIVDTVIIFDPPAECDLGTGQIAHRVKNISRVSNDFFYWPQGDANPEADGCWIPHTRVLGYMIELHKNVHLENSGLRYRVNSAKAYMETARRNYERAEAVQDQKQDRYDRLRLQYCGSLSGSCKLPPSQFNELTALRNEIIAGLEELLRLLDVFLAAVIAYELVYWEALNS